MAVTLAAAGIVPASAPAVATEAAASRSHAAPPHTAVDRLDGAGARQDGERTRLGECAAGELCLWARPGFRGDRRTYELSGVPVESCVPLPKGVSALSFANRTGRPATVYQSGECAETGEFHTHPSGSWTPEGEYRVRAFKLWER